MSAQKADASELNYDMNYNMFLLKTSMQNLKSAQGEYTTTRYRKTLSLYSASTLYEVYRTKITLLSLTYKIVFVRGGCLLFFNIFVFFYLLYEA